MSEPINTTEPMTRKEALAAYRACRTDAERAALYWDTPILQEIISAVTHPKPASE